jgi:hypothetical protein
MGAAKAQAPKRTEARTAEVFMVAVVCLGGWFAG